MLKIAIITLSDRAFRGEYADRSGPKIREILQDGIEAVISNTIIPDDAESLFRALGENLNADYIITTGGTGISPRDITADISRKFCDFEIPGISEMLRMESLKETRNAVFSRGFSGIKNNTFVINFPGSVKAVTLCTRLILPLLTHGVKMRRGEGH